MKIGVPKEIKIHEYRVGLVPAGDQALEAAQAPGGIHQALLHLILHPLGEQAAGVLDGIGHHGDEAGIRLLLVLLAVYVILSEGRTVQRLIGGGEQFLLEV